MVVVDKKNIGGEWKIINNLLQEALFNCLFGRVNSLRNLETDDEDSEVEHCYGPGKLRAAKSINDMCDDQINNNSSNSRRYLSIYYVYIHMYICISNRENMLLKNYI